MIASGDWLAGPTIKTCRLTPRILTAQETLARVAPIAPLLPVTRLADLGPLDRDRPHVFCAVTPLARDLTTHLGKGLDPASARAAALMEAVERISAEDADAPQVRATRAEMRRLGRETMDPRSYGLPADAAWMEERAIGWMAGRFLVGGGEIWLPTDLVLSPPREGLLRQVDTNGLASGNSLLEAVLHALCEVIERDAVGQAVFADLHADPGEGPLVAPLARDTLPRSSARLADRMIGHRRSLALDWITSDIALPVVRATAVDAGFPTPTGPEPRAFIGYGCDPDAEIAVNRALTEAAQSRVAAIQGARDSFNASPAPRRPAGRPAAAEPFGSLPNFSSTDLAHDLAHVLGCLAAAGFGAAQAVDLTRAAFGIPVVRVRVPGLTSFLVDRSRVDPRCLRWLL